MNEPITADVDFISFIADLSNGDVNTKLSEKLAEVVAAVEATGSQGVLTLKVGIKKEGTMAVAHVDVAAKVPELPMPGTMFFFGKGGSLHREDPRQLTLRDLRPTNVQPIRNVGGDDE